MKGAIIAAAAALTRGASARLHNRHAHPLFERANDNCECTTLYETWYGEPTLIGVSAVTAAETPMETTAPVETVTEEIAVVPTAAVETCPTPGVYTFPATTMTVTETTTVCGASSTHIPAGEHTLGGVTTVVETSTEVVCPYATVVTEGGVVTSTIQTTTYVCPTPGTYTIAPITTSVVEETVIVVPIVETYTPGTYTRDEVVTTITETSVVVVCPYTVSPIAEAEATPIAEAEPTTKVEESITTKEPEIAATTSSIEEVKDTPTSTPSLGSDGDHFAMTYTPYTTEGMCKSKSEIDADLATIAESGFKAIRVYSTDCNTLEYVGGACRTNGVKMILGIFINGAGCTNSPVSVDEQIQAIAAWADWELVDAIVVGNEAIFGGFCSPAQIAGLISTCRSTFSGFTGPFTTAETLNIWQRSDVSAALCDAVDMTGANIHPYFNAEVSPESAGDFVEGQLALIDAICPGKTGINLECGWPSAGLTNGAAIPGKSEQATAISGIRSKVGSRTVFFSFHNDGWKEPGACGCEQSWGCGDLF